MRKVLYLSLKEFRSAQKRQLEDGTPNPNGKLARAFGAVKLGFASVTFRARACPRRLFVRAYQTWEARGGGRLCLAPSPGSWTADSWELPFGLDRFLQRGARASSRSLFNGGASRRTQPIQQGTSHAPLKLFSADVNTTQTLTERHLTIQLCRKGGGGGQEALKQSLSFLHGFFFFNSICPPPRLLAATPKLLGVF